MTPKSEPELMTPGDVGRYFGVNPKTVTKWSAKGWLTECRTLGGHRRFIRTEVEALRKQLPQKDQKRTVVRGFED
jgi:excisionase family DNA binding protein